MYKLILLCAILGYAIALIGPSQSFGVHGRFTCDSKPAHNVLVKLFDDDIIADDLMAEEMSDFHGYFNISGYTDEFSAIEPKFNVYHRCNFSQSSCSRKFSISIPLDFVTNDKIPTKFYEFSTDLAPKRDDEGVDCLH